MGLLQPSDWKAEWIGAPWQGEEALPRPKGGPNAKPSVLPPPAPLLRKEFVINKNIVRAVAYVTGLGYFELYVNGKKVGDDQLDMVTYSNDTPFGTAGISWHQRNGTFRMDVRVPVGSTATVYVPTNNASEVTESGQRPDTSHGVTFQRMEAGYAIYRVGSGQYSFQVRTAN